MGEPRTDHDLLAGVFDRLRGRATGRVRGSTVGERLVAVEVDAPDGPTMGVAHRPPGTVGPAIPTASRALARWAVEPPGDRPIERALGIATLNALSAPLVAWQWGDPMESLAGDVERIATVGLFRPAFRKFDAVDVRVIERAPVGDLDPPDGVTVSVFPPEDGDAAIEGADVVFVTGSSLVYGGTLAYLRAAAAAPTVVLIGATASFLPGPAFDAGVATVAGVRVVDPDAVRAGIGAGLCGTDLHDRGLRKGFVTARSTPAGLDLPAGTPSGQGDGDRLGFDDG